MAYKRKYYPANKKELQHAMLIEITIQGKKADLNCIDASRVTDMSHLFADLKFNGDISKRNVSNVKDMAFMFYNTLDMVKQNLTKADKIRPISINSPYYKYKAAL